MKTSLKKSCPGSLYLANMEAIQSTCKFKTPEATEKIFKMAVNTNQVCPIKNIIQTQHNKFGNMVLLNPGCYIWTMD
jgi:hypothetical protein